MAEYVDLLGELRLQQAEFFIVHVVKRGGDKPFLLVEPVKWKVGSVHAARLASSAMSNRIERQRSHSPPIWMGSNSIQLFLCCGFSSIPQYVSSVPNISTCRLRSTTSTVSLPRPTMHLRSGEY